MRTNYRFVAGWSFIRQSIRKMLAAELPDNRPAGLAGNAAAHGIPVWEGIPVRVQHIGNIVPARMTN
jgi:hypothetical protein